MNIIITGAGKGIGYAATQAALAQGHTVWAISRNIEALQTLQKSFACLQVCALDITSDLQPALSPILQQAGKVDVLIHNAGVLINKPFMALSEEDWRLSWATNVMGAVRLTQLCVPFMGVGGHIVHIGSMGGFQGSSKFGGLASYSTTKGALATLTECLAVELQEKGIHVNCLALGAVDTEMLQQAFPAYQAQVSAETMGAYLIDFATKHGALYNGKVLPVAVSVP